MRILRIVTFGALGLAVALSAYGLLACVASSAAAPSGAEVRLAEDGASVQRSFSGPLAALAPGDPGLLVLVDPPTLMPAERDALDAYVARGGHLWILSLEPQNALWPGLAGSVRVLPGAIYGPDGKLPSFRVADEAATFARDGMQAILTVDLDAVPLVRSESGAVRDTNGDGVLGAGEPTGPFDAAVRISSGSGDVTLVAERPSTTADGMPYASLAPEPLGPVVVVDYADPGAWAQPARTAMAMFGTIPATWWMDAVLAAFVVAALAALGAVSEPSSEPARARQLVDAFRQRLDAASLPPSHPLRLALERESP